MLQAKLSADRPFALRAGCGRQSRVNLEEILSRFIEQVEMPSPRHITHNSEAALSQFSSGHLEKVFRASATASRLMVEQPREPVDEPQARTACAPRGEANLIGFRDVAEEGVFEVSRECRIPNAERILLVELPRARVEVRRADDRPSAIDHDELRVDSRWPCRR